MADGDPMVLQTVYGKPEQSIVSNGPFDIWSWTGTQPPAGWTVGGFGTITRVTGARTGGSGIYYVRRDYEHLGGSAFTNLLLPADPIELAGNDALPARGHYGAALYVHVWAYENGTDSPRLDISLHQFDDISSYPGPALSALTVPTQSLHPGWYRHIYGPYVINEATCKYIAPLVYLDSLIAGDAEIYLDDLQLFMSYTFAANPSMPDDQDIFDPTEKYARTISGSLVMGSGAAGSAKHQKMLNFGLIGLDQFKALRSLRLLKRPMRWTPNQPHMPASLDVRMTAFKFGAGRGAFGSNIYRGSMELSEI